MQGAQSYSYGTTVSQRKNYYKILGVRPDSTLQEIKDAYIRLSKQYHPDVAGNDADSRSKFVEITEAFSILGKETNRKEYDFQRKVNAFREIEMGYKMDYPKPDVLDPNLVAAYEHEMRRRWNERLIDWMKGQGEYELERGHHITPIPAVFHHSYSSIEMSKYVTITLAGLLAFALGMASVLYEIRQDFRGEAPKARKKTVVI